MKREKESIRKRLLELEIEIEETQKRLPAHSIKPQIMIDLLALEDERDELLAKYSRIDL